ncbi:beta strand repeat-containing protein, partial [Limnohabitans radicicola]
TGAPAISTVATAGSNVGSYAITTAAGNLAAQNYQFSTVDAALTVNARPITVAANARTTTYGTSLSLGTTDYSLSSGTLAAGDAISSVTLQYNSSATVPGTTNAATYANGIVASAAAGTGGFNTTNYAISYSPANLTVNKATLTVTADNKSRVYGDANPALTQTISGFLNGDTISVVTGSANASTTASSATAAGTATISASAAGLTASNYNFNTLVDGTLTITPRPVTLSATAQNTTYGTPLNLGTSAYTLSSGTLASGDAVTAVTLQYNGNATVPGTTNAATYANGIVASAATGSGGFNTTNYAISYVAAGLTVNPKPITLGGQVVNHKTYDGTTSAVLNSSGATLNGVVNGDAVTLDASGAYGTFASANVANGIAVTVAGNALAGASAANYTLSQPTGLSANITPAPLTVTANADSKIIGQSDAAGYGGVSYSGFVAGQSAANLGG